MSWRERVLRDLKARRDLSRGRRRLLETPGLSDLDRRLLRSISLKLHNADSMYVPGAGERYLAVGLSAARCIHDALSASPRTSVRSILDFPSGSGRVLRYLRVQFRDASIVAGEIDPAALQFCATTFGVSVVRSQPDIEQLILPTGFDLIWSGSLLTHLDGARGFALLRAFCRALAIDGVCVFSTHGRLSEVWMRERRFTYDLTEDAQKAVLDGFEQHGYGYGEYRGSPGYGVSIASEERMTAMALAAGPWCKLGFVERGWDNHQDVYVFGNVAHS
jgi:SAM-dependent methyltransferase